MAKEDGLDLIEISPNAVNLLYVKLSDIGKYKYDLQKKVNKNKKETKNS